MLVQGSIFADVQFTCYGGGGTVLDAKETADLTRRLERLIDLH